MTPSLASSWTSFCKIVWPDKCALCGAIGEQFCDLCRAECRPAAVPGRPLEGLDEVRAAFLYQGRAKEAVARLKFSRALALATPMAASVAALLPDDANVVVPVPVHWTRRSRRGFNQATLLCEGSSLMRESCLVRVRRTGTQRGRDRAARLASVRGAFVASEVAGLRVVLVDDVCTSGGTLRACAEALREAGAASVRAVVFARLD